MLDAARKRFAGDERVEIIQHDLAEPLLEVAGDGTPRRRQAATMEAGNAQAAGTLSPVTNINDPIFDELREHGRRCRWEI